jgi:hypothetical protein
MRKGMLKLCLKGTALAVLLICAVESPLALVNSFMYKLSFFRAYHLFWLITSVTLIKRMIPRFNVKVTTGKIFAGDHAALAPPANATEEKLRVYVKKMNRGALRVAAYWTLVVLAVGACYLFHVFGALGLFMTVAFFIFMDQFCVSVWCPFEWIIGNKCCNTCRINNWGYLMAFAPLVYVPSFWTWSVLALSALVVIQWEYLFHAHPERFFELCNARLVCRNCKEKCGMRRPAHRPFL